ncbi:hypothetical protein HHI36_000753 [Cryptolaemus montrouzieri]|uniref:Uncharacterized protein n=1 Tax=Cryptolaemus montrouzieri TaxID=559131 RepID=A0ABD2P6A5_9CUCU
MYRFIPLKTFAPSRYPKWFNSQLLHMVRRKNRAHRQYKRTGSREDYLRFRELRASCHELGSCLYLRSSTQNFWRYINHKQYSHELPNTLEYRGVSSDGGEIVNCFADIFSKLYSKEYVVPPYFEYDDVVDLSSEQFTQSEIFELISGLG